jgi:hypothetical protein
MPAWGQDNTDFEDVPSQLVANDERQPQPMDGRPLCVRVGGGMSIGLGWQRLDEHWGSL